MLQKHSKNIPVPMLRQVSLVFCSFLVFQIFSFISSSLFFPLLFLSPLFLSSPVFSFLLPLVVLKWSQHGFASEAKRSEAAQHFTSESSRSGFLLIPLFLSSPKLFKGCFFVSLFFLFSFSCSIPQGFLIYFLNCFESSPI